MESSPSKKPRLDPEKTIEKESDSVLSEEIVENMDTVGSTSSVNSSIHDSLMAKEACHSKANSTESVDQLFEAFFKASDRKPKNLLEGKDLFPVDYHKWGSLAKIKEKSVTLRDLTLHNVTLENISNCTDTFIKILEELKFEYRIVELKSLKPSEIPYAFAFDVKSTPKYSFSGNGPTKSIAINGAAKHGITFFVASCE